MGQISNQMETPATIIENTPGNDEDWKHLKPWHNARTLFQQEDQGNSRKFSRTIANAKKGDTLLPRQRLPPSAIFWIKYCSGLCDVERHYAPLNTQLFSLCLNRKGHAGSCQHAKGHVISNKGVCVISKAAERRVKLG